MRLTIIMIVYCIIYFGGWAILGWMWHKAKQEANSAESGAVTEGENNESNESTDSRN